MKPAPFEYHAPDSIERAMGLMSQYAGEAKILAGGQSLVPAMNFRIVQPSSLIELNRVPIWLLHAWHLNDSRSIFETESKSL